MGVAVGVVAATVGVNTDVDKGVAGSTIASIVGVALPIGRATAIVALASEDGVQAVNIHKPKIRAITIPIL
jgi:hypothetical protein